jgi:hypothetical protein
MGVVLFNIIEGNYMFKKKALVFSLIGIFAVLSLLSWFWGYTFFTVVENEHQNRSC